VTNCLEASAAWLHAVPLRAVAFRMVSSFRMQATRATLVGLPAVR
jgi:hypothetical protein